MEQKPNIRQELQTMPHEPLLAIEKRLIGWSLIVGVVLMAILIFFSHTYFPA